MIPKVFSGHVYKYRIHFADHLHVPSQTSFETLINNIEMDCFWLNFKWGYLCHSKPKNTPVLLSNQRSVWLTLAF